MQFLRKSVALVEAVQRNADLEKSQYTDLGEREARGRGGAKEVKSKKVKVKSDHRRVKSTDSNESGSGKKKSGAGKVKKGDSAKLSYEMFRSGKKILEIAAEREMASSTIEGHLANFVETGELDILEIMDEEKLSEIKIALKKHFKDSINPVKQSLGEGYSYGEIRMVLALGNW